MLLCGKSFKQFRLLFVFSIIEEGDNLLYSSLQNHLFNLTHYAFAFFCLFIFYPKIIFKSSYETKLEDIVSNYILMVLVIILMGYVLVVLKIYEFIGIFMVMFCIYSYSYYVRYGPVRSSEKTFNIKLLVFDYLDKIKDPKKDIKNFIKQNILNILNKILSHFKNVFNVWNFILLVSTLLYAAYLRFYDTFINAAPAMSDSYVTLEWMKSISNRILFVDGIYPQGFHIYMATLQKFAFIDPLYILRYTGPLNGVLTTFSMYFVISRTCKDKTSGIIGAVIYGILITLIYSNSTLVYGNSERQAATNSQEFGYVFVMPTLYFFCKYFMTNKRRDFITAFAGVAITGLVHTISFVFIAIGVFILIMVSVVINIKKYWTNIYRTIFAGIASGIISVAPVGIGVLMGKWFHSSSESFLTESSNIIKIHELYKMDKVGIASITIVFIYLLFNFKHIKENLLKVSMLFISIVAFLIYYIGGYLTKSQVVASRLTDFWPLVEPVIIGMAFYAIANVLRSLSIRNLVQLIAGTSFILFSIFYVNPLPIIPYKMEHNANEEQYLRISEMLNPTEWMIVSQIEGYSVVKGKGYHLLMGDFLKNFDPENVYYDSENEKYYLINKKTGIPDKTQDIFLFEEKNVFTTQFSNGVYNYSLRRIENQKLQQWVYKYMAKYSNISIFYEDNNIRIYRIHQGTSRDESLSKIWGK